MAQWMVNTTKYAVDGLCKQHRDRMIPKGTMIVDTTKDAVDG